MLTILALFGALQVQGPQPQPTLGTSAYAAEVRARSQALEDLRIVNEAQGEAAAAGRPVPSFDEAIAAARATNRGRLGFQQTPGPPDWAFDSPDAWVNAQCDGLPEAEAATCVRQARNALALARVERMELADAEAAAIHAERPREAPGGFNWRCEQVRVEDRDTGYSSTENICGTGDDLTRDAMQRQLREAPVTCRREPVETPNGIAFGDRCREEDAIRR